MLLTGAIIALNPQLLHIASSVSNDSLTILAMNLGLYLAARWINGQRSRNAVMIMGLVAGAALLTKLSASTLGLMLGILILATSSQRLRQAAFFGAVACWCVAGGRCTMLCSTAILTAIDVHIAAAPQLGGLQTSDELLFQLRAVVHSFWAAFGWGQLILSTRLNRLIFVFVVGGGILGLLRCALRWSHLTREQRQFLMLLMAVLVIVFALLIRWMTITQAPHGRLLFPAILPISLLIGLGLTGFFSARRRIWVFRITSIGLFVFAVAMAVWRIIPAYQTPAPITEPQSGDVLASFRETTGGVALLRDVAFVESPQWIYVQLTWQVETPFQADYLVFVHALGADGAIIAQRDSYPGLSNRPFTRLEAGDMLHDVYPLTPPATAIVALRVGIYRSGDIPNTWERLATASEHFRIEDNAVTLPLAAIRVLHQTE